MPCGSKHLPQFYSWWQCTTINLRSFPLYWILWSNFPVQCEVLSGTMRTGKYSCKWQKLNLHWLCVPAVVMIHDCSATCQASDTPLLKFICQPGTTMEFKIIYSQIIKLKTFEGADVLGCDAVSMIPEVLKASNAPKRQKPFIWWHGITFQKTQTVNHTSMMTSHLT